MPPRPERRAHVPRVGVLCALPEELGSLAERAAGCGRRLGLELLDVPLEDAGGARLVACVAGIGKVRAAAGAAALLVDDELDALVVVGVCGGLVRALPPGALVHCVRAVQFDLAVRADREVEPDPALLAAWSAAAPGERAWFLTGDRPALTLWRRVRLARAYRAGCVADMETAAAAAVAQRAGVPWAALRTVTDGLAPGGVRAFRENYPRLAGRAADTLPALVRALASG